MCVHSPPMSCSWLMTVPACIEKTRPRDSPPSTSAPAARPRQEPVPMNSRPPCAAMLQTRTQVLTSFTFQSARRALYRGQCNCPYWHGAFGGIYLPHLRNAIYNQLIACDNLLDHNRRWICVCLF